MIRHPIFVMEGPDACGKTTLAHAICDLSVELGYPAPASYKHLTYRWQHKNFEPTYHLAALRWAIKTAANKGPAIIDRWWPSAEIYSKVYRDGTRYPHYFRWLDALFQRLGGTYVLCLPDDPSWTLERHAERLSEEMYQDITGVVRTYNLLREGTRAFWPGYTNVIAQHDGIYDKPSWQTYKPDLSDPDSFAKLILDYGYNRLNRRRNLFPYWSACDNLLGDPATAAYLVVAEQPSPYYGARTPWPWMNWTGSAPLLCEALDRCGVLNDQLLMTNVYDINGTYNHWLSEIRDEGRRSLALGRKAELALGNQLGLVYCHHPQYLKRFQHSSALGRLTTAIEELTNGQATPKTTAS
ncbi:MAG: hypothetical protein R3330_07330 [Saprospiraceae bacterium]|nr:hypothetical protein [Saprospiraceae bacterium]